MCSRPCEPKRRSGYLACSSTQRIPTYGRLIRSVRTAHGAHGTRFPLSLLKKPSACNSCGTTWSSAQKESNPVSQLGNAANACSLSSPHTAEREHAHCWEHPHTTAGCRAAFELCWALQLWLPYLQLPWLCSRSLHSVALQEAAWPCPANHGWSQTLGSCCNKLRRNACSFSHRHLKKEETIMLSGEFHHASNLAFCISFLLLYHEAERREYVKWLIWHTGCIIQGNDRISLTYWTLTVRNVRKDLKQGREQDYYIQVSSVQWQVWSI